AARSLVRQTNHRTSSLNHSTPCRFGRYPSGNTSMPLQIGKTGVRPSAKLACAGIVALLCLSLPAGAQEPPHPKKLSRQLEVSPAGKWAATIDTKANLKLWQLDGLDSDHVLK